ncbi:MAG: maleylacetoacetate isomerase [Deltaproteobacteria bacterium]|nr:maleylacetoacetate isomerase [Deltaproteobacteria bacterium]
MHDLTLYGYWRSSATWRVRIGLHLLGVGYEYAPVHLVRDGGEQYMDDHIRRNPLGQVPVLTWNVDGQEHRLAQSLAILEYLDETTPGQILPTEPFARARARQLAEMVNAGIQPMQNLWMTRAITAGGADGRGIAREAIRRGLAAMQAECDLAAMLPTSAQPRTWLVGDSPTIADICLIPQLYNARRFDIDLSPFPALTRVDALADKHPAFRVARPEAQPDALHPTD